MSAYDVIPSAESLLAENIVNQNELQATLAKDVVKTLKASVALFRRGLPVIFYPTVMRDAGEYKRYWIEHHEEIMTNLSEKGYIVEYNEANAGMKITVSKVELASEFGSDLIDSDKLVDKTRTPITNK